jgi:NADH-quinone oxidoreductase subunit N
VNNEQVISALLNVYPLIVPEAVLLVGACVLFLGGTFRPGRTLWGAAALMTLAAAGVALWFSPHSPVAANETRAVLFASPLYVDRLAVLIKAVALVGGAVLVLCSWNEVPDRWAAEFHACLLILLAGICLSGSANELVTLFVSLELISIPTYVLLYLPRNDIPAQEAAMKYFLLSVFSSALLLFGFSYLYGMAGTTNLTALAEVLDRTRSTGLPGVALIGLVMVVAGLGFRIAAVPFHFYAPDVYQGTTPSLAALLSFLPKVAGFIALLRVLGFVPHEIVTPRGIELLEAPGSAVPNMVLGAQVPHLLWILATVTMTLGNVLGLLQDNIKRMLAYSSVANAGYMLIGLFVARFQPAGGGASYPGGVEAVLFYLLAYGAMTIGAFAVLGCLNTPQRSVEKIDDLAGLSRTHPGLALLMVLFLFSLIGLPATAGFAGKLLLFWGAMAVEPIEPNAMDTFWFRLLALIGVLNAAIAAWYYLRVAVVMYLRNPLRPLEPVHAWPGLTAVCLCAALTLVAGLYPPALLNPIRQAMPRASGGALQTAVPPPAQANAPGP